MRRLRGLCSLVVLLAIEAIALATLWWAVHVPEWHVDWSHFNRWLDATPQSDVGIGLAATVGLVLAGWLALSTGLYLLAHVLRVPALIRATSIFTVPGVKRIVEGVAAVSIVAGAVIPAGAAFAQSPAGGWSSAPPAATATVVAPSGAPTLAVVPPSASVAPTAALPGHWTVAPGDNLWDISAEVAAHQLGTTAGSLTEAQIAPYWQQVMALTMPHLRSGDANLIYAGEVVVLAPMTPTGSPADVSVAAPATSTPAPTATSTPAPVTVAPQVTAVQGPATTAVPTTAATPTTVAAPATTAVPTVSARDTAPGVDTSAPLAGEPGAPAPEKASSAATTPAVQAAAQGSPSSNKATTWAGGGLLGAAVVMALAKARKRSARLRKPGEILVPAARDAMETERLARVAADTDGVVFVDAALRALAGLTSGSGSPPEPIGFMLNADTMTVVLAEAAVAPLPFRGRGTTWVLSRSTDVSELEDHGREFTMPMPGSVTLGRNAAGDEVVVDLEDSGMLSIVGPGAEEVVAAAAIQLAAAPWTTLAEVILVGFASPPTGPTVRAVDSIAEVIDELEDRSESTARILLDNDCRTTLEARMLSVADDAWVPTIVVCASAPADHLARRLVGVVDSAQAAGVAALVAGPMPDSPWEATIGRDGLVVESMGTTVVTLQQATARETANIRDLLDAAAQAPVLGPPVEARDLPVGPEIIINVYGAVSVDGAPEPTDPKRALASRGKSLEAFVFLACHRGDHVDGDRLMEAMWPDCDPKKTRATLANTLHHLRQAVGSQHVPKLRGGERLYSVNDITVATTVQIINGALANSRSGLPADAIKELREALDAIHGRPFDMPSRAGHGGGKKRSAWEWAFAENYEREALEVAGDGAHRLHQLAMEADDLDTAAWAVRQGLRADPDSEQMRRDEMAVAKARRSLPDLDSAMLEAERHAGSDDDGVVDAVTVAVYREAREALEGELTAAAR